MFASDGQSQRTVRFDTERLSIEDIVDIAAGSARVALSDAPEFRAAIARGADFLDRLLRREGVIYGVTTGVGDSCTVTIDLELVSDLPRHLYTMHGCGLGEYLSAAQTRAVIATRLASLCKGFSGVSFELLEQMVRLLERGLLPLIPSEGSVGASGDLTPLSYLAAALCGEGEVCRDGKTVSAAAALAEAGITPLRLRPKEALAVMSGTAVMTALACLAYARGIFSPPGDAHYRAFVFCSGRQRVSFRCELTEQVAAGLLIAGRQGTWLRRQINSAPLSASVEAMLELLDADIAPIEEDRRLEPELRILLERIRARVWKLYE